MTSSKENNSLSSQEYLISKTIEVLELWDFYKSLFWGKKSDFELLIHLSGGFFEVIQTVLQHDIILRISKLLDEQKATASYPNFVRDSNLSKTVEDSLLTEIRGFRAKHKTVFSFRHNLIAHSNAKVALKERGGLRLMTSAIQECLVDLQALAEELLGIEIEALKETSTLAGRAEEFLSCIRQLALKAKW